MYVVLKKYLDVLLAKTRAYYLLECNGWFLNVLSFYLQINTMGILINYFMGKE